MHEAFHNTIKHAGLALRNLFLPFGDHSANRNGRE